MEKELVEGKIGSVGDYGLKFSGSKLVAKAQAAASAGPVQAKIEIDVELDAVDVAVESLKWMKVKIPGQFDDIAIDLAIAEILKLKDAPQA